MSRWVCPRCDREFARPRQAHVCVPGGTVDASFVGQPPARRAAYDRIIGHLATLGPVHEDAVGVGVFLKRERKFAEVRPMVRALAVDLFLPRVVVDPRVVRHVRVSGDRTVHSLRMTGPDDVDAQVLDWLTEAYEAAGFPA
jgi:hypothetical protein